MKICRIRWKKRKIKAITAFKVIQGHRGRYQSNARFLLGVTAESLQAKRDRKSAISLQRGQFDTKFQVEGVAPTNNFCTVS